MASSADEGVHHQRGRNRESNRGKSAELKEATHLFVNVSKDAINGLVKLHPTYIIDIVGEFTELGVHEVDPRREKAEELEKAATELSLSSVTKLIDLFCKRMDRLKNGSNTPWRYEQRNRFQGKFRRRPAEGSSRNLASRQGRNGRSQKTVSPGFALKFLVPSIVS